MKITSLFASAVTVLCMTTLGVVPASAQQAPAPAGSLQIEKIQSGFVIAPDAKFTEVDDRFATLAGVYGGWLTDRTLLVGAGAYWLANRGDDFKMQYYGGLVRWTFAARRALGLSAGGFVGFGDATLGRTYGELFPSGGAGIKDPGRFHAIRDHEHVRPPLTSDTRLRINDGFVMAEPQVNGVWNITSWMQLNAGVGYRFVAATDLLGDELRGPSGSLSIQFGGH
jgi:hypothetical protein